MRRADIVVGGGRRFRTALGNSNHGRPQDPLADQVAGLHGIEQRIEPPAEFRGNAYAAPDLTRVPRALHEAIPLWERSTVARAAFGDDVVDHYLNMARVEQQTYDAAVTSWERERYLERG